MQTKIRCSSKFEQRKFPRPIHSKMGIRLQLHGKQMNSVYKIVRCAINALVLFSGVSDAFHLTKPSPAKVIPRRYFNQQARRMGDLSHYHPALPNSFSSSPPSATPCFSKLQAVMDTTSSTTDDEESSLVDRLATQITNQVITDDVAKESSNNNISTTNIIIGQTKAERFRFQLITLFRVGIPSILAGITAFFLFPALALFLASIVNDTGVFAVLSQDSSQFVQNFLTVSGLLFSILIGQTYAFLYQQQEAVFYALFNEVTEAKSLLEQVALVCQGRAMYSKVLESISKYVRDDLKQLQADPAILISARPIDDPLESIMYMTSVGVPSSVYDTVRSLRQARAARLGALQRKLPRVHMLLLWLLAGIELVSFPLLGAGTQTLGGYNILTVEGALFGIMTFGIVMTMKVISELYRPGGGMFFFQLFVKRFVYLSSHVFHQIVAFYHLVFV